MEPKSLSVSDSNDGIESWLEADSVSFTGSHTELPRLTTPEREQLLVLPAAAYTEVFSVEHLKLTAEREDAPQISAVGNPDLSVEHEEVPEELAEEHINGNVEHVEQTVDSALVDRQYIYLYICISVE